MKTLLHEFDISYRDTEWYLLFSVSATTRANFVFVSKKSVYLSTIYLYSKSAPLSKLNLGYLFGYTVTHISNFQLIDVAS